MDKNRGFTLIEILISVAIIGVLATIGIISYSKAQIIARDSKRKDDLRALQTALELYYQRNRFYPPGSSSCAADANYQSNTSTSWDSFSTILNSTYISKLPNDPINNTTTRYYYISSGSCSAYQLAANLENDFDTNRDGSCTVFSGCDYLLTNP